MDTQKIEKLLELIGEIVNAEKGSWNEKRDLVLNEASQEDKTNLLEFAGWFEE